MHILESFHFITIRYTKVCREVVTKSCSVTIWRKFPGPLIQGIP